MASGPVAKALVKKACRQRIEARVAPIVSLLRSLATPSEPSSLAIAERLELLAAEMAQARLHLGRKIGEQFLALWLAGWQILPDRGPPFAVFVF